MFKANETINGLYGYVYDENGQQLSSAQEFEAVVELQKEAVKQAGKFMEAHKVLGGSGSGNIRLLKLDSRLQQKLSEDPTAKFNYLAKLADPTARGEEAVLLEGVSFDSIPLTNFELGAIVEIDIDFTFDDYRYVDTIT